MEENFLHKPVLLKEVIHFLDPSPGKVIIDATIGGAGHSEEIMTRIYPGGMLLGIDRDSESLKIAHERLKVLKGPFKLVSKNFSNIGDIVKETGIGEVDGILFDLGISSMQMEAPERGFSIKNAGPLDMRMDRSQKLTAKDLVNTLSEAELSQVIKDFGEERFYKKIARAVINVRKIKEIQNTSELAEIVISCIPYRKTRIRIHPATRTFQALRIRINDELENLKEGLAKTPSILKTNGRICVISFHSLEDRIVKNIFKEFALKGFFHILTKKPVMAKACELSENPRARSAKLRAAVKIS